jgi:hypothetical protein
MDKFLDAYDLSKLTQGYKQFRSTTSNEICNSNKESSKKKNPGLKASLSNSTKSTEETNASQIIPPNRKGRSITKLIS